MTLTTNRLTLRRFTPADLDDFATLHANLRTMADLGGPIPRAEAKAKLDRYLAMQDTYGITRLHVSTAHGFIGYVGVGMRDYTPPGFHAELGWRLLPHAWGFGYATEAARAILPHAFRHIGTSEILSYTMPDNLRSQAVMDRIGLTRETERDFDQYDPEIGAWRGLVWVAYATDWSLS